MKSFGFLCAVALWTYCCVPALAADPPFSRGINLTRWFEAPSPRTIQLKRFTIEDFRNIKSLGADVIRLPINLHAMTSGPRGYVLDPLFLDFLDRAVDMAEEAGIHLILDDHTFDPIKPTPRDIERTLLKVWPQMAERFKDRSDYVVYEILNEPHGLGTAEWGRIQGRVIEAIRKIDRRHAIIVGASNYNNIHELKNLPTYSDGNLIYTFHFYDPMAFTHQGADFTSPSLAELRGVPYPPDAGTVPPLPSKLKGTWLAWQLANYATEGSPERLKETLDEAIRFGASRGVRVFCGEFGVYKANSADADRVRWYRDVREYLEKAGVPWAIWDYKGSFGPFVGMEGGRFDYDLNVPLLLALGFTPPVPKPRIKEVQTPPVPIYGDYAERGIISDVWRNSGRIDFYAATSPASGRYSIQWKDSERYGSFRFQFDSARDFSRLVEEGCVLQFMARTNSPKLKVDVRFMNGDDDPEDLPWRMVRTLDSGLVPPDGAWHLVRIPLSEMKDVGAWKNATQRWYDGRGSFSWADVVSLQFAAEQRDLSGVELDLDEILITK